MTTAEESRRPIDAATVTALLNSGASGGDTAGVLAQWSVTVVADTASTNADLLAAATNGGYGRAGQGRPGPAEGAVLVAEFQHGGRGRLDRRWSSPRGAGLTVSMLVRPPVPMPSWGWLPLLTGVALCEAVDGPLQVALKWPNDLLIGAAGAKAAGILVQTAGDAAVIGVGMNVSTSSSELPVPTATSLLLAGSDRLDRAELLAALLDAFAGLYRRWVSHGGDAVAAGLDDRYRAVCSTLGSEVSVELGERRLVGTAVDVDESARLLVRPAGGGAPVAVAAGDVTHLRPVAG